MAEQYDFFELGKKYATAKLDDLNKLAKNIEKQYGKDARLKFESGIAVTIPVYQGYVDENFTSEEIHGTKNYGVPNLRNNSYFGEEGTSVQYIHKDYGEIYNDPEGPKKGGR